MNSPARLFARLEAIIRRDPARRGLCAACETAPEAARPDPRVGGQASVVAGMSSAAAEREDRATAPLLAGDLEAACRSLAALCGSARPYIPGGADIPVCPAVGIVTGFFVPDADPPAAETDGPPGAVLLARALDHVGIAGWLVTDPHCHSAVAACARAAGFDERRVLAVESRESRVESRERGDESTDPATLRPTPHTSPLSTLEARLSTFSTLIAVERAGPSHTLASLAAQRREGRPPLEEFARLVPEADRDRCFNIRGRDITEYGCGLHRLFERVESRESRVESRRETESRKSKVESAHSHTSEPAPHTPLLSTLNPQLSTLAIGDGGNEIGMGKLPWEVLARLIPGPHAAKAACRIACDHTILCGVSNWGAYSLAAGTLWLCGEADRLKDWTPDDEARVIERMVAEGPAVDGVTRLREATVDGLPLVTYLEIYDGIRRAVGAVAS